VNPYLRMHLDRLMDLDPIDVLRSTPERLEALAERLGDDGWTLRTRVGGWTFAEVAAHLADVELAMGFRLRQALAGVEAVQAFDQDAWAVRYPRLQPTLALEAFRALRAWNLALFATLDLDDWLRSVVHPERGAESVDEVVRSIAGHDLRHLDALATLVP
jgi:hypothetical protein